MTRTIRRTTLGVAAALTTLALTGCGGDDAGGGASPEVDTAVDSTSSGDSGDAEPRGPISVGLDTLGYAIEAVMGNVEGYEVDGSTLRIRIGEDFDEYLSSECTIISTVAASTDVPDGSTIELEYDDGVQPCEIS